MATDLPIIVAPGLTDERRLQIVAERAARREMELALLPRKGRFVISVVVGDRAVPVAEPRDLTQAQIALAWLDGAAGQALIAAARTAAGNTEAPLCT